MTPNGKYEEKVAIETIKAGDWVLSFDEITKVKSYKKVTDTFVRTTDLIYTINFVNGEKLETTWNHPFWVLKKNRVRDKRQVELGVFLVGMNFIDSDSFSIENDSSKEGEWVEAKALKAGDVSLLASGKQLFIASITITKQSKTVYNFSVADNHTYYVGVDGVLVHNQNCMPVLVQQAIENFASAVEESTPFQAGINYSKGVDDSVQGNIDLAKSIKNCGAECRQKVKDSLVEGITKPPIEGIGEGHPLTPLLNLIRMGGNVVNAVVQQGIDATGWNGARAAGKAHTDLLTDITVGAIGAKGVKALKEAGGKLTKVVTNEINQLNKNIINGVNDGIDNYGKKTVSTSIIPQAERDIFNGRYKRKIEGYDIEGMATVYGTTIEIKHLSYFPEDITNLRLQRNTKDLESLRRIQRPILQELDSKGFEKLKLTQYSRIYSNDPLLDHDKVIDIKKRLEYLDKK